jgi:hypothetical protein
VFFSKCLAIPESVSSNPSFAPWDGRTFGAKAAPCRSEGRTQMAPKTTGLTNGGVTAHYRFQYDDSLAAPLNPGGPEPARTKAVVDACEGDFNLMSQWFANIALDVNFQILVNVTQNGGGARWSLSGGNLTVTINPANGNSTLCRYLLVSEMVEQFMRAQGRGWYGQGTEGSEGEGLSRFLAAQFLTVNGLGATPADFTNSNSWLNSPRADFVNNIKGTDDGPDVVTGCSLLFIYYLFSQLDFSINAIVSAGAPTLAGVYRNLTGNPSDPFPFFKRLLDRTFPGTSTITGGNLDDPFPLIDPDIAGTSGFAVARAPYHLDVYWVGPDGTIGTQWWDSAPGSSWENHLPFPITPPGAAQAGSAVVALARTPNHLDVYWVGPDGTIGTQWWDSAPGSSWETHLPFPITPPGAAQAGSRLAAVARTPNHLDVYWVGPDGTIGTQWWDSAPGSSWETHPPFPITPPGAAQA